MFTTQEILKKKLTKSKKCKKKFATRRTKMKMWHIRLGSPFSEAILQEADIVVFSLNSESCIRETPLQQEKSKLCFSPSLDKGQQMPAELLSRVLRKRIFSTSFLGQPDED